MTTETTYAPAPSYTPPAGYPQQPAYPPAAQPQLPSYPPPYQQDATVQQPTYQQPAYQQPTYQQPTFQQGQPPVYPPGYQYPAGYQQPAYAQQWAPPPVQRYGNNVLVILGALWLFITGLAVTLVGVVLLAARPVLEQAGLGEFIAPFDDQLAIGAIVLIVLGIVHLLVAIFIWAHRSWARVIGILLSALGTLWGLGILYVTMSRLTLSDGTIIGPAPGTTAETTALIANGIPFALYAITLLALLLGGGHFSRRRVE